MALPEAEHERPRIRTPIPSVGDSPGTKMLPAVLSVIAGSTDVISFLGLGGLFTAHITGNLVILAAHLVSGGEAQIAAMLSVPVFVVVLGATRLLAGGLESLGLTSLQPLLLLQFLLLTGVLVLCATGSSRIDPNAPNGILAGMLGVAAMAVQNALAQISLKGAPTTAVMTTNITRFMMDIGEVLLGRDPKSVDEASGRARCTWPAITGFAVGCALGAACEASFGLRSLALPASLALLAVVMAPMENGDGGQRK
jgi:uncharacterized membrane protein YoaK (UPF0700 family)